MVQENAVAGLRKHDGTEKKLITSNLTDLVLFVPLSAADKGATDGKEGMLLASVSAGGESSGGTTSVGKAPCDTPTAAGTHPSTSPKSFSLPDLVAPPAAHFTVLPGSSPRKDSAAATQSRVRDKVSQRRVKSPATTTRRSPQRNAITPAQPFTHTRTRDKKSTTETDLQTTRQINASKPPQSSFNANPNPTTSTTHAAPRYSSTHVDTGGKGPGASARESPVAEARVGVAEAENRTELPADTGTTAAADEQPSASLKNAESQVAVHGAGVHDASLGRLRAAGDAEQAEGEKGGEEDVSWAKVVAGGKDKGEKIVCVAVEREEAVENESGSVAVTFCTLKGAEVAGENRKKNADENRKKNADEKIEKIKDGEGSVKEKNAAELNKKRFGEKGLNEAVKNGAVKSGAAIADALARNEKKKNVAGDTADMNEKNGAVKSKAAIAGALAGNEKKKKIEKSVGAAVKKAVQVRSAASEKELQRSSGKGVATRVSRTHDKFDCLWSRDDAHVLSERMKKKLEDDQKNEQARKIAAADGASLQSAKKKSGETVDAKSVEEGEVTESDRRVAEETFEKAIDRPQNSEESASIQTEKEKNDEKNNTKRASEASEGVVGASGGEVPVNFAKLVFIVATACTILVVTRERCSAIRTAAQELVSPFLPHYFLLRAAFIVLGPHSIYYLRTRPESTEVAAYSILNLAAAMLTTTAGLTALTSPLVLSLPDRRAAFINAAFFYFIFIWVFSIAACEDPNLFTFVDYMTHFAEFALTPMLYAAVALGAWVAARKGGEASRRTSVTTTATVIGTRASPQSKAPKKEGLLIKAEVRAARPEPAVPDPRSRRELFAAIRAAARDLAYASRNSGRSRRDYMDEVAQKSRSARQAVEKERASCLNKDRRRLIGRRGVVLLLERYPRARGLRATESTSKRTPAITTTADVVSRGAKFAKKAIGSSKFQLLRGLVVVLGLVAFCSPLTAGGLVEGKAKAKIGLEETISGGSILNTAKALEIWFTGCGCFEGQAGGGSWTSESPWNVKDSGGATLVEACNTASGSFCIDCATVCGEGSEAGNETNENDDGCVYPHSNHGSVGDDPEHGDAFLVPFLFSLTALVASVLLVKKGLRGWRVGRSTVEKRKGGGFLRLVGVAVVGLLLFSESGATAAEEVGKEVAVVRGKEGRRLEVWEVGAQVDLYNKISSDGSAKMTNGDSVMVARGIYMAGSAHDDATMFKLSGLYGNIKCSEDSLICELTGSGTRQVMFVSGSSGNVLELRSLVIVNGYKGYGGGLFIENAAQVTLVLCSLQQNQGTSEGGGIRVKDDTTVVDLYGVSFSDNASPFGPDIKRAAGTVTVHSTCSAGGEAAVTGSALATSGTITGPNFSHWCGSVTGVFWVATQPDLYDKISQDGASRVNGGDTVTLAGGIYIAGSAHRSTTMFSLNGLYGNIKCSEDSLRCELDGSGMRTVMEVAGTSSNALELRSLVITNGYRTAGGGIHITGGALVKLVMCCFQRNEGTTLGGGIYLFNSEGAVNLYGVSFWGNTSPEGPDIKRGSGTITVHTTCPSGYATEAAQGAALSASGSVSGSLYSFTCADHVVSSQEALFGLISSDTNDYTEARGANNMADGSTVVLSSGTYAAGIAWRGDTYIRMYQIYGKLRCVLEDLSCELDGGTTEVLSTGASARTVMCVHGTGGSVLEMRGLVFKNGYSESGDAGLSIYYTALVDLVLCRFQNNIGGRAGAISFYSGADVLNLYGVDFVGNMGSTQGDDLYRNSGTVTVHTTCPSGYATEAAQGAALSAFGSVSGSLYSFKCADHVATSQVSLFELISADSGDTGNDARGSNNMKNGDTAILTSGNYAAGTAWGDGNLFRLFTIYGYVHCVSDDLTCHLDGESARTVMSVIGTGGGILEMRGLVFKNGYHGSNDGGLSIYNTALVDLVICRFQNNNGAQAGAIYITGGVLNLNGVAFSDNTHNATTAGANDIHRNGGGTVTIGDTCPAPFTTEGPTQGAAVDTSGTISGPFFSYMCNPITHTVSTQAQLFPLVARDHDNMADGDSIILNSGNYAAETAFTFADEGFVFILKSIYGNIRCEQELGCELDGAAKTAVMSIVEGTGGGVLEMRGLVFKNGRTSTKPAAGLYVPSQSPYQALVDLVICRFQDNEGDEVGGIKFGSTSGSSDVMNLYGVVFSGNSRPSTVEQVHFDILTTREIAIHPTCPPGFPLAAAQGATISTFGSITGKLFSFICTFETKTASTQSVFYNLISAVPNVELRSEANMDDGDTVLVSGGDYAAGSAFNDDVLFRLYDLMGNIKCSDDNLLCILNGGYARQVMNVVGTGGGILSIRGFVFKNGSRSGFPGGLCLQSANMILTICHFDSNLYQAIGLQDSTDMLDLSGVTFADNTDGDVKSDGTVLVLSKCPTDYPAATQGAALTTTGTINGPRYSQVCQPCADGSYASSASCVPCPSGKTTLGSDVTDHNSADDCSEDCPAGTYGEASSSASTCTECPRGTYNPTSGLSSSSSCVLCDTGKVRRDVGGASADSCEVCVPGTSTADRMECVLEVAAQIDLYDKISLNGASKMSNGDTVNIQSGSYVAGSAHDGNNMFWLVGLYGNIRCATNLACELSGSGAKRVMGVIGTSGAELELRNLLLTNGDGTTGGGMHIAGGALVTLVLCSFQQNEGTSNGGGVYVTSSVVNLYGVSFSANISPEGPDIYRQGVENSVTVHSKCAPGYADATEGSDLSTVGTIVGSTKSLTCDTPCSTGYYSGELSSSCMACPSGKSTSEDAFPAAHDLVSDCEYCPAGKYEQDSLCTSCTGSGYTPSSGYTSCSFCDVGAMVNAERTACVSAYSCAEGKGTTADGGSCEECPAGKYSNLVNNSRCQACPKGTYSTTSSKSSCTTCDLGKVVDATGSSGPSYCTNCDIGKMNNEDSSECSDCPAGTYNQDEGAACDDCPSGKYLDSTGAIHPNECKSCISGTSNDGTGLAEPCTLCTAGKSAPSTGYEECALCVAGTYSAEGAATCTRCAVNEFNSVSEETTCAVCASGSYNTVKGSVSCTMCTGGTYLNAEKTGCADCPSGSYSNPGASSCSECDHAKGYVSKDTADGETVRDACIYCGPGEFADHANDLCGTCSPNSYSVGGSDSCIECAVGSFTPSPSSSSCTICLPGTVVDGTTCSSCPQGTHAPYNSIACLPCSGLGQFQDETGQPSCKLAPPGSIPGTDRKSTESCAKDHYSLGAVDVCSVCPNGGHSNPGDLLCENCLSGQRFDEDSNRCEDCVAGESGDGNTCTTCSTGKYSTENAAVYCATVAAGSAVTKIGGFRSGTELCPTGHFSAGSADDCTSCDESLTFQAAQGQSSCVTCSVCGVGKFIKEECTTISDTECEACDPGSASLGGATACDECSGATQAFNSGSSVCLFCAAGEKPEDDNTGCVACTPGRYSGVDEASCSPCLAGSYSEAGAGFCATNGAGTRVKGDRSGTEECPRDTFSIGATEECTVCEGGHSEPGSASCIATRPGFYWDGNRDVPCEAGTAGQGKCLNCDGNGEYSKVGAAYCSVAGGGMKPLENRTGVEDCPADTYSIGVSDTCSVCEEGGHALAVSSSCFFCRLGEEYDSESNTCVECVPGSASLGEECVKCDQGREFSAESGSAVCSLSPPGKMPNANRTGVVECPKGTDMEGCPCPVNTYLSKDGGICEKIPTKGVNGSQVGLTLETLSVLPGFWRTGAASDDVRGCPVAEACMGGNKTELYCRGGHEGPYCNLCEDGYAPDAFMLCQECKHEMNDVLITIVVLVVALLALFGLNHVLNKKVFMKNPRLKKSIKTGAKIMFVSSQILASLPSIVPAIALPENYKEALNNAQFLNLDLFQLVGVGCYSSGFNLNWSLVGMTVVPLLVCGVLVVAKMGGGAIAVTFLVLPTVTTQIFQIFPCDNLDDDTSYLHADYSLSCEGSEHMGFVAYGVLMLLVYPVGVLTMYAYLLIKNKERIKKEEERDEDEGLQSLAFLYDPYKGEYWWFEVFETARRLAMTGVLGAISPGSDLQLSAGILMTVGSTMVYVGCVPFIELKDNALAVLTNLQIMLVMMTAQLMKGGGGGGEEGVGGFLIFMHVLTGMVFIGLGWMQVYSYKVDFESDKTTEVGLALGVLKGKRGGQREKEGGRDVEEGSKQLDSAKENEVLGEGVEMAKIENPLQKDTRHLDMAWAVSGGLKVKVGGKKKGGARKSGGGGKTAPVTVQVEVVEVRVAAAAEEEVGGQWEKHHDAASGHDYWENKETGQTQWTAPYNAL